MATLATILDRFTTANSAAGDCSRTRVLDHEDPFEVPRFPNEDVYLYVKHIDNSRIFREVDPGARKACWRLIGSSFAFAVLVIGLLLPSVNSLMAGYRMEALRQERQRLELDRAARLEELARMQRFVDPAPEAVVYLEGNKSDAILAKK
jgi:hypothetical protein